MDTRIEDDYEDTAGAPQLEFWQTPDGRVGHTPTDQMGDGGCGCGLHGHASGLHYGELFSVSVMQWKKHDTRVTTIHLQISYAPDGRTSLIEFDGDFGDEFRSDEDCLAALPVGMLMERVLPACIARGIAKGRRMAKNEIRNWLGTD